LKESIWGYAILTLGILAVGIIWFFANVTRTDQHNYNLLKETTEAAMLDAVDLAAYRIDGTVRIEEEKFVENFIRRFAENADLSNTYRIEIYDVNETPPKVSLRVLSSKETNATGEIIEFDIVNNIDAILETKYWEENKKMNNFMIGLKRFFTNKNVVTIILVIVILVVLYFGYSGSIKKQTNPVSMPTAAEKINPKTKITSEMLAYKQIPASMIDENAIRNTTKILDRYTNVNVTIPAGSLFYEEWLVDEDKLPGNWIEQLDYEAGELGYYMDVNVESTLGNNVLPETYIDIYMKANDENGTIMFGKLMKNVKVLVVHDGSGNNVFDNTEGASTPSKIGFAVNQDYYILLKKAEYLNIDLVLAPRGATVPTQDYVIVTSATLRDYIDAQTITIQEDVIAGEVETPTEESTNTNTEVVE